jgi:hypothetical protein
MIGDSDIDMGGTAAGLLDMHTGFSSTSTPMNSFPTPQPQLSGIPSSAATPSNLNVSSPAPAPTSQPPAPAQQDVQMGDAEPPKDTTTAPDQGPEGDWVVVPKDDTTPPTNINPANTTTTTQPAPSSTTAPQPPSNPASAAPTPVGDEEADENGNENDFSELGDLDTAGDALASYSPPSGGDDELNMDLEDSAFGDAFHGVERAGSAGDTPGL